MFNCLKELAPANLSDLCVGTAAVVSRSGLRLQLEEILLCWDTGQSGVQGLLLWLVRNVGTNCRLDSEICRLALRLSRDA